MVTVIVIAIIVMLFAMGFSLFAEVLTSRSLTRKTKPVKPYKGQTEEASDASD